MNRKLISFMIFIVSLSIFIFSRSIQTPTSAQGTCGLSQVAFCDSFDTAMQNGPRTGDMDHSVWSAGRLTENNNPSQGIDDGFYASNGLCGNTAKVFPAPDPAADFRVCNGQFQESLTDGGQYVTKESYIRQPFDFANRMGSFTFDVDAITDGSHTWWPEIWLTTRPIPAPGDGPGTSAHPEQGVQFKFDASCGPNSAGLGELYFYQNYQIDSSSPGSPITGSCYTTQPGALNHFQIKISTTEIQVWASDAGGSNFRQVDDLTGFTLPFTRGLWHIEHTQYDALKFDTSSMATSDQTYIWDNIGFDGPILPIDRAYDIPDATTGDGTVANLGYDVFSDGSGLLMCCPASGKIPYIATLQNVDPSNAAAAFITLNSSSYVTPLTISYNFNGGPWVDYVLPVDTTFGWTALAIPVPVSSIPSGNVTISFKASAETQLANIGLKIVPNGLVSSPSPSPTPSNSPNPTSSPTPTPSPIPSPSIHPSPTPSCIPHGNKCH